MSYIEMVWVEKPSMSLLIVLIALHSRKLVAMVLTTKQALCKCSRVC